MKEQILKHLPPAYPWKENLHCFPSLGSTNDHLRALAKAGAPHGTAVLADHQTGGLSLTDANRGKSQVKGAFSTRKHSGVAVPVYAAGVGAGQFTGVRENTELAPAIYESAGMAR